MALTLAEASKNGYWDWGSAQSMDLTSGNLRLGRNPAGNALGGAIGQTRISTVARSQSEVDSNWDGGLGRKFDADAGTAALWRMNEEAGNVLYDQAVNQNNGTVYGAGWTEGPGFPSAAEGVALLTNEDASEDGTGEEEIDSRENGLAESGYGIEAAALFKLFQATEGGVGLEEMALILALVNAGEDGAGADRLNARVRTSAGSDIRFSPGFSQANIPSKEVKP